MTEKKDSKNDEIKELTDKKNKLLDEKIEIKWCLDILEEKPENENSSLKKRIRII